MVNRLQEILDTLLADLTAANASAIAEELKRSENGTLSLSFGIRLCRSNNKCGAAGKLTWARKFHDEAEAIFEIDDPNQAKIPLADGEEPGPTTTEKSPKAARKLAGK